MAERWRHELRKLEDVEPPGDLSDRIAHGPRRAPSRPRRTWRVIAPVAAGLAIAVFAGLLALIRPFGPAPVQVARHSGRFADPRFGWTIRYPKGMAVGHFNINGFATSDGVRVTNFPPDLQHGHAAHGLAAHLPGQRGRPADLVRGTDPDCPAAP